MKEELGVFTCDLSCNDGGSVSECSAYNCDTEKELVVSHPNILLILG